MENVETLAVVALAITVYAYGLALLALEVALRVVYRTTLFVTRLTPASGREPSDEGHPGPEPDEAHEPAPSAPPDRPAG